MRVDTRSDLAWEQYRTNLRFAREYEPRCRKHDDGSYRVLVSGFGRFGDKARNATGELVSELLDEMTYPFTTPPPGREIDPPGPQTAVAQGTIQRPYGKVSLGVMVLPVAWDLAPLLVLAEAAALEPHLIVMNGIALPRHELYLELGAINRAKLKEDGSTHLRPAGHALIPGAEHARGNFASWRPILEALERAVARHANDLEGGERFGDIVPGVLRAGFPRDNTYLCNNVTYTVGYVMDHPHEAVRLLEASHPRRDDADGMDVRLPVDLSRVPRLFVHWPSELRGAHLTSAASILMDLIDAQLAHGELPERGDNLLADLLPTTDPD